MHITKLPAQLLTRQANIERHEHGTQAGQSVHKYNIVQAIGGKRGYTAAFLYTQHRELPRHMRCLPIKFGKGPACCAILYS